LISQTEEQQMSDTIGAPEEALSGKPQATETEQHTWLGRFVRSRIFLLIFVNLAFMAVIGVLKPVFLTRQNLTVVFTNLALETIVMCTVVLLLVGGLFDLSLDGIVAMAGIIAGKLMEGGTHAIPAVAAGMGAGLAVGLINGLAVNKLKVNPLMGTLATWWITLGIAFGITRALSPYGFPEGFQAIGQVRIFGLKIFVYYALVAVIFFSILLNRTRFGWRVFAMGGDRRATRLYGVNTDRLGIILYLLAAGASSFVGIVLAARLNSSTPNAVDGMTLRVIAAAVIGGAGLAGGRGSVIGALLGLLLMSILTNATILFGVSPFWQKGLVGLILFVAVVLDAIGRLRETRD
jgi:ribose transport system permease protein